MATNIEIPKTQTAAIVRELGGPVEFVDDYPVPEPGQDEVLAKVLYTGVCHSDLTIKSGVFGKDPTRKMPHIGGHEGIGRIVALGPGIAQSDPSIEVGGLVGIRYASRICRRCEFCISGKEQYCVKRTNHLHHESGSFQQYIALDAGYLTLLPPDCDPVVTGPVLCAGMTVYKAVLNTEIKVGEWLVIVGAGGGLGHFAVQYGLARGAKVLGIDSGQTKKELVTSYGADFLDFTQTADLVSEVMRITDGGAHGIVVAASNSKAYAAAADMLRTCGTLAACGVPEDGGGLSTPITSLLLRGITVKGNLTGNLKECMEAVEQVRMGLVKPNVSVRPFRDLPAVYEEMERGEIVGRIVLKIGEE